ncbi:MAG: 50S ribosomal protein L6 [Nanoarchaeota archaeon]|nr:50S ribosomal protein L6 [Nanoarchaeota archaeon]
MPVERLTKEIEIPEGIEVEIGSAIIIKGPKGEVKREVNVPTIEICKENNKIIIKPKRFTKRQKALINTFVAHIKNMFKGVIEGFVYKLKICSSHFPMTVKVEGDKLVIKNFYGEKVPRVARIMPGVKIDVKGEDVIINSIDKELAGQTAANIEAATRITNRDRRVFQDGIWIVQKDKKVI